MKPRSIPPLAGLLSFLLSVAPVAAAPGDVAGMDGADTPARAIVATLPQPGAAMLPPTRPGARLEFIPIHPVHFAHDEAVLDDRARWILDDAVLLIRHLPGITRVIVKGFTDYVAGEPYNDSLSDRRAAVVRDYLLEHGVAPRMLHMTGYGENKPVDEEWTREGRARNRRVEIYLVRHAY